MTVPRYWSMGSYAAAAACAYPKSIADMLRPPLSLLTPFPTIVNRCSHHHVSQPLH